MSAGNSNQNGASASSSCKSLGDPTRVLSLEDGTLVETHWITDTREVKFFFAWTIKDFSLRDESINTALEFPTFPSGPKGELEWRLQVYPN